MEYNGQTLIQLQARKNERFEIWFVAVIHNYTHSKPASGRVVYIAT